jgi:hypothetical protein
VVISSTYLPRQCPSALLETKCWLLRPARLQKTVKFSNASRPRAMAAGITGCMWDMINIAALIVAQNAPVANCGPNKKKAA